MDDMSAKEIIGFVLYSVLLVVLGFSFAKDSYNQLERHLKFLIKIYEGYFYFFAFEGII